MAKDKYKKNIENNNEIRLFSSLSNFCYEIKRQLLKWLDVSFVMKISIG
jgi:hypothetical protein